MLSRQPLDATFIDIDIDEKKITNQEGRNRAIAAKELGLNIPVIVYARKGAKYVNAE